MFGKARDVLTPVTQRRILDGENTQAIKQVLSEASGLDLGLDLDHLGHGRHIYPHCGKCLAHHRPSLFHHHTLDHHLLCDLSSTVLLLWHLHCCRLHELEP
jgi:hypothetical protein